MRFTGHDAAVDYLRRHVSSDEQVTEIDSDLAHLLSEGLIEVDPTDDSFTITPRGREVWETQRVARWEAEYDTTLAGWRADTTAN